jgi:N-methylhydantoinase B
MDPGDILPVHSPGGRDPFAREPDLVLVDPRRGHVSPEAAAHGHGVVIRDGAIDGAATAARRTASHGHVRFGPARAAHEAIWTAEACAAMTRIMSDLPIHWRFVVKTRLFDMLRAPAADDAAAVQPAFAEMRASHPGLGA